MTEGDNPNRKSESGLPGSRAGSEREEETKKGSSELKSSNQSSSDLGDGPDEASSKSLQSSEETWRQVSRKGNKHKSDASVVEENLLGNRSDSDESTCSSRYFKDWFNDQDSKDVTNTAPYLKNITHMSGNS